MPHPAHPTLLVLLFTAAEDQEAFDQMIALCAAPLLAALPRALDHRISRATTGPLGYPPYEWMVTLRFPDRPSLDAALASARYHQFETLCRPWSGLLTLLLADERKS